MTESRGLKVWKAITRDLGLKIAALIAALVFFSAVHGSEDAQKTVYIDVISDLPEASTGRILVSEIPARIRLTLVGSRTRLAAVRQEQLPAIQVDLRDTHRRKYSFSPDDFDLPLGVAITEIEPPEIILEWARRRERRVPIRPQLIGRVDEELRLTNETSIEPNTVVIVGPADEVIHFDYAETTEIDLSSLRAGENEKKVRLVRPPMHSHFEEDPMVTVHLTVVPQEAERTFSRLEVNAMGANIRALRPARVSVSVFGTPSIVQSIDPETVFVTVNVEGISQARGAQLLPVQVHGLPEGVEMRRIVPHEILVTPNAAGRP